MRELSHQMLEDLLASGMNLSVAIGEQSAITWDILLRMQEEGIASAGF